MHLVDSVLLLNPVGRGLLLWASAHHAVSQAHAETLLPRPCVS
jgi:hypothetical protein